MPSLILPVFLCAMVATAAVTTMVGATKDDNGQDMTIIAPDGDGMMDVVHEGPFIPRAISRGTSFSRILRSGDEGFSRIYREDPSSFSRILRSFSRILRAAPYERDSNAKRESFARILRAPGFARIHKSDQDDIDDVNDTAGVARRSGFSRILRGGGGSSFSRILRGEFSRILKRDPVGFSRIL